MNWQTLILLQSFLVALSLICIRVLGRNKKMANASFVINAGLYVALYAAFLVLLPWFGRVNFNVVHDYWWRFLGGGLAFALTNVCTYKTVVYFDAAIATIIGSVNALFTIIGAALVLKENLSILQALGAVVLLSAITYGVLATRSTHGKSDLRSIKLGVLFALLAGLSFAVAAVNEKSLLGDMSTGSYALFGIGGQFLMSIAIALIIQPKKLYLLLKPKIAGWVLLSGFLRGLGGACFILAEIRSNNVGLVSIISNFKLIFVVLLGWWLLKERNNLSRKAISAAASIAGLAIMLWR